MSLADALARAANGDEDAFMAFYDATSGCVFSLALTRAHRRGLRGGAARTFAEREVLASYASAWSRCAEQAGSGLPPLAWVLALPYLPTRAHDEVACA